MKLVGKNKRNFSNRIVQFISLLLSLLILPIIGYTQGPPVPGGSGGPGSLPDSPTPPVGAVPFDWRLNLLLVLAGMVFAMVIKIRMQKAAMQ